uniref:Uncharacterized protein n=1 Tax=Thermogemmatispora argillosa TaxID=2045280 RepID=A0A455T8A8_9CHLR|nr:hypothetical protein KTA_39010 [Thermogemmatispora argillosa]
MLLRHPATRFFLLIGHYLINIERIVPSTSKRYVLCTDAATAYYSRRCHTVEDQYN